MQTYRMSICVSAGGLSVSIYNNIIGGKPLRHEEVRLKEGDVPHAVLRSMLTRPRVTDMRFSQVQLVADTPATLLPLEDFRSSELLTIHRLCFPRSEAKPTEVCHEVLSTLEVVVIFSLANEIQEVVRNLYPEAKIRSRQSLLMEQAFEQARQATGSPRQFHAFVSPQALFLCLFQEGRLRFACSYEAENDADRLYYLLSAWKGLQMDTTEDPCHLHDASDMFSGRLCHYIRQVTVE